MGGEEAHTQRKRKGEREEGKEEEEECKELHPTSEQQRTGAFAHTVCAAFHGRRRTHSDPAQPTANRKFGC